MTSKERFKRIFDFVIEHGMEQIVTDWIAWQATREFTNMYTRSLTKPEINSKFIEFYHFLNELNEDS